jgi:hypothetical protein
MKDLTHFMHLTVGAMEQPIWLTNIYFPLKERVERSAGRRTGNSLG